MVFLLTWLSSTASIAQNETQRWATAISPDELTDEELSSLPGTEHPTSGSDLYYIRFADVATLNNEEMYTVKLTKEALEYAFDPSYIEIQDAGDFYLAGSIAGHDAIFEFTPITGYNGRALIEDKVVDFIGITESLSHVRYADVFDDGSNHDDDCLQYTYVGEEIESSTPDLCPAVVDVLFLRTSEVEASFPYTTIYTSGNGSFPVTVADFNRLVSGEVRRTNTTLQLSRIGSKRINAIIHPDPVDEVVESPSSTLATHTRLRQNVVIEQLRQQYDADVVVMYFYDLPQFDGIANDGFVVPAEYSTSYVSNSFIGSAGAATFPMNAAHELGHVFGGHHPWAYELRDPITGAGANRPTMMRGCCGVPWRDTYGTISHFSNENVNFTLSNGPTPTGTDDADNGIRISENFCNVADFELSGGFSAFITFDHGPSIPLCSSTLPLCAEVVSGNTNGPNSGPYTYEWRYSLFPTASTTVFSTEECPTFSIPFSNFTLYYVTLDVTNVNTGQTTSTSKAIQFNLCAPDFESIAPKSLPSDVSTLAPVEKSINVNLGSSLRTISSSIDVSSAELFRTDGVKLGDVNFSKGNNISFEVNTPSGLYYVVLRSKDGQIETHPVWYVH